MIKNNFPSGVYEFGSGIGTSVNELISKVEKVVNKKIDRKNEGYILKEAEELIARNTIVRNPTSLEVGIMKITDFIKNDNNQLRNT